MPRNDDDFFEENKQNKKPTKEAPPTARRRQAVTQKRKQSPREHQLPAAVPLPGQSVQSRDSKLATFRNTQGIKTRARVNVREDEESDYESEEDDDSAPDYDFERPLEEDSLDRQFDEYLAEHRTAREMSKTKKKPSFFSNVKNRFKRMFTRRNSKSKVGGKGSQKKRRKNKHKK
jgi:hypothetical protein